MAKVPDRCPYCNKQGCVIEVAFENVRHYGSQIFTIPCLHCKKIIRVGITRTTYLSSIAKSDKTRGDCDW